MVPMQKIFFPILVFGSVCLAQSSWLVSQKPIPSVITLSEIRLQYQMTNVLRSAQNYGELLRAEGRLKDLTKRAETQKIECAKDESILWAATVIHRLYNNYETEQQREDLKNFTEQLDQQGCCALLPEFTKYTVQK